MDIVQYTVNEGLFGGGWSLLSRGITSCESESNGQRCGAVEPRNVFHAVKSRRKCTKYTYMNVRGGRRKMEDEMVGFRSMKTF